MVQENISKWNSRGMFIDFPRILFDFFHRILFDFCFHKILGKRILFGVFDLDVSDVY